MKSFGGPRLRSVFVLYLVLVFVVGLWVGWSSLGELSKYCSLKEFVTVLRGLAVVTDAPKPFRKFI
jgi:hypothetical protein